MIQLQLSWPTSSAARLGSDPIPKLVPEMSHILLVGWIRLVSIGSWGISESHFLTIITLW